MDRREFLVAAVTSSALMVVAAGKGIRTANAEAVDQQHRPPDSLPEALQQKLAHDPLRPQFHLLPRHNWMNDPCAPRWHRGEYHMFFQYNPGAAVWGDMHWNHATSRDLVHWKHQPIALAPGPGKFDAFGIFTGSVLPGMDVPTVLYTGVSKSKPEDETIRGEGTREVQCLATAIDDDLRSWKKLDQPVIAEPPPGMKVTGFRDPCPWKEGDRWYLGIGSGINRVGGAVLLYTSTNGRDWTYLHPLAQGKWNGGTQTNPVDTGEMWECPDFFPLGDKYVLLYSTERKVYWNVGVFDKKDLRFHMETSGLLDHGAYYAMKSMVDAEGRRILWGWVTEKRSDEALLEAGWSGSMALPRVLSIDKANQLQMTIPGEFSSLKHDVQSLPGSERSQETTFAWLARQRLRGRAGHFQLRFKLDAPRWQLELHLAGIRAPLLALHYGGAGTKAVLGVGDAMLTLVPGEDNVSSVEAWLDGSIIEILVDGREAITIRDYTPSAEDVAFTWTGSTEALLEMSVSGVTPISPDRLTT